MEKLNGQSMDLTQNNLDNLKQIFPEVFNEGSIDFDKLRLVLGDSIDTNEERYEFRWSGKSNAIKMAQTPSTGTLRPDKESSKNWDTTENLYIEGDNLEVLKLLQKSYFGKVKMIYIDPPYNTGKDFVYKDNFRDNIANYKKITNQTTKANPETNGRYHTDWLNMMYPRLKLARNLLREDGVIFISIDDNEVYNLRKLCDEIFGEDNFVAQLIWKSRQNKDNRNLTGVSIDHEYILVYCKENGFRVFKGGERNLSAYKNPDNDVRGNWTSANMVGLLPEDQRPNCHYDLINPDTGINYGKPAMGWRYDKNTMSRLIDEDRIIWPVDANGRPRRKVFLNELSDNLPGYSSIVGADIYTRNGTLEIEQLLGKRYFNFPKSFKFIKEILNQSVGENDIILDFFSGSATTAHAVMQLNAEDGGSRKFIMVQIPEAIEEKNEAYKAGYKNICEIGKERIRKSGEKVVSELGKDNLDIGFKVFKLDDSNIKEWNPDYNNLEETLDEMIDNLKLGRNKEDLLFEILIKMGIELTESIKEIKIADKVIYNVGRGSLLVCLEDKITPDIINEIPKYKSEFIEDKYIKVIFKESGFMNNDTLKMNAIQNLKQFGITDVRSV